MIGDAELLALRQTYYTLFVKLLWVEPPADLVASLGRHLDERAAAAAELHPRMGEGWHRIGKALETMGHPEVLDEFTRIFLGPYRPQVSPYESFYLTGTMYSEPLIHLREFMAEVGLKRIEKKYAEPEDVLAFELEIMNWLIAKQKEAGGPEAEQKWVKYQARFLEHHLLVWGPACARDLAEVENAPFYAGLGAVLEGFLAFEKELFQGLGAEKVKPLDEARRKFSKKGGFTGPVFDPLAEGGGGETPEN